MSVYWSIHWPVPVYHEPILLETLLSVATDWIHCEISRLICKSDPLMRLLNLPNCQHSNLFTVLIFLGISWILYSLMISQQVLRAEAASNAPPVLPRDAPEVSPPALPSVSPASSINTTPAPGSSRQGLRSPQSPRLAQDESPSRPRDHTTFALGKSNDTRPIRKPAPGAQRPFAKPHTSRTVPHPKKIAPLRSRTMRQELLDAEGNAAMKSRADLRKEAALAGPHTEADVEVETKKESEYDEDIEVVYDSPTRTWGNKRRSRPGR